MWKELKRKNGIKTVKLSSWKDFSNFINEELLSSTEYIFRGQYDWRWRLQPTFDRVISPKNSNYSDIKKKHLENLKYYSSGRLKFEYRNQLKTDNDWWAIGQHNGLSTPLLDWTESPFIAAYFAFQENAVKTPHTRIVYALAKDYVEEYSNDKVALFHSHNDDNSRLINQRGLFTITEDRIDIESYINKTFELGESLNALYRIHIPENLNDRENFLRFLNRMNINHLTLFPDLIGTSEYVNKHLQIDKY